MKLIKIDIKKEEITTDRPYLRVAEFPNSLSIDFAENGEAIDTPVPVKEKVYHAMQVNNPETKKRTNYFVNTNDDGLFKDLIEVSKGFIEKKSNELLEKFKEKELPRITSMAQIEQMKYIKELSWWKRLFNKF